MEFTLHAISLVILFGACTCLTLALLLWMAPWGNRCLGLMLALLDYAYRDDYYNTVDNERSRTLLSGDTVQYGWVDGSDWSMRGWGCTVTTTLGAPPSGWAT